MSDLPLLATLKCSGPNEPWSTFTPLERFNWMFSKYEEGADICGESTVIIDTSVPDDFWPEYCPKCGTDINWDISVVDKMQQLEVQLRGYMI